MNYQRSMKLSLVQRLRRSLAKTKFTYGLYDWEKEYHHDIKNNLPTLGWRRLFDLKGLVLDYRSRKRHDTHIEIQHALDRIEDTEPDALILEIVSGPVLEDGRVSSSDNWVKLRKLSALHGGKNKRIDTLSEFVAGANG